MDKTIAETIWDLYIDSEILDKYMNNAIGYKSNKHRNVLIIKYIHECQYNIVDASIKFHLTPQSVRYVLKGFLDFYKSYSTTQEAIAKFKENERVTKRDEMINTIKKAIKNEYIYLVDLLNIHNEMKHSIEVKE